MTLQAGTLCSAGAFWWGWRIDFGFSWEELKGHIAKEGIKAPMLAKNLPVTKLHLGLVPVSNILPHVTINQ